MDSPKPYKPPSEDLEKRLDKGPTGVADSNATGKRILFFAKVFISISILSYLFYTAGQKGQWEQLRESPKRWHWVGLGVLACLSANLISFYRWHLLVRAWMCRSS